MEISNSYCFGFLEGGVYESRSPIYIWGLGRVSLGGVFSGKQFHFSGRYQENPSDRNNHDFKKLYVMLVGRV